MSWLRGSLVCAVAAAVALGAAATPAWAKVKHQGSWPDPDKPVTLDVSMTPRTEALRKLADAAGWSLVVHAPAGDAVDVHVKQAPASKVLDILLSDGDYVATRDGDLVSIEPGQGAGAAGVAPPAPPVPPVPPAPPVAPAPPHAGHPDVKIQIGNEATEIDEPHARGQDRTVMGGDVRIARGEIARDVTVFGGNVDIEGDVTGDVSVFGGNVRVHDGAHVHGDSSVYGGTLSLDPGAKVDGDVSTIGGTLHRDPSAHVGGDVTVKDGGDEGSRGKEARGLVARGVESVMDGIRLAAVLFVIGTVLLALAGRRMDALRVEVATRPMRSIALGLVGIVGFPVVIIALCVTIIGIPIALIGAFVFGLAVLGAMCAVLSVVGEGLLRHKTENPYVHLAVGCALFVGLAALPWVGGLVIGATVLAGVGVLVATRGAGLLVKRNGAGPTPYRTHGSVA